MTFFGSQETRDEVVPDEHFGTLVVMHYWAKRFGYQLVQEDKDTKSEIDRRAATCLESDSHSIMCLQ